MKALKMKIKNEEVKQTAKSYAPKLNCPFCRVIMKYIAYDEDDNPDGDEDSNFFCKRCQRGWMIAMSYSLNDKSDTILVERGLQTFTYTEVKK
jgi:transposase-like protein